ncbi:GNAT family N-acetyltransferase [Altererythrobacter arenosus]|uniref:GNAT family N-acetyltransferase n=1 Tax=Altererythrobacter arenosus TaxID=3032592 RepID=A0ABY8FPQ0_9SPHN|nr:GNAT family N-acetyltransferase [Altererythrobacter sp. CAU 1644]WFL76980.1 GNAT family N-acetyltransferase [Altererythrobacter sp. CAU 1644]
MAYSIRPYKDVDAEDLAEVIHAAIEVVGAHKYSAEQVAAWAARHPGPERYRERVGSGDVIFVAAGPDDRPVAYALIELDKDGRAHLDHLYCHPDHTRRGLAVELLATAEEHARASGATLIYTEASELARAAFERAGYAVTHRRDFEIAHDGSPVAIHNYAMEKALD